MNESLKHALDRVLARRGLADACTTCGGIGPTSRSVLVLVGEPRECPACGLDLDEQGHAVGFRDATGLVHSYQVDLHAKGAWP